MKKEWLYLISMLIISIVLYLYDFTGIGVHIVFALFAVFVTVVYSVYSKYEFKRMSPTARQAEYLMHGALVFCILTGVFMLVFKDIELLDIMHNLSALLYVILLILLNLKKIFTI